MIEESDLQLAPLWATGRAGVELVSSPAAFTALRPEWSALLERSDGALFLAWEWLYPWWRRIAPDRAPRLLLAREAGGRLCGLLPLAVERRWAFGRRVRRWAFLGETHVGSDGLDALAERGREEELSILFAGWLREHESEWDVLELTDLEASSPLVQALRDAFGRSHVVEQWDRHLCPFEVFRPGETFDAFLRRCGRRDNFLRRRKWLAAQPGFRLERSDEAGALAVPMAELLRLHAARWAADGGSQGIRGPATEAFHRDATEWMAERGKVRLYTMWMGDRAVASVYALIHRGELIYFQSGYDPEWRNRSVGLVLVGETFRDALDGGLRGYDFLRGTEPYKSDWTSRVRRTVAVRIHRPRGAGARFCLQQEGGRAARTILKGALPGRWVERIRRARRVADSVPPRA
ncbi:MAG TPA: GNAT family N-acetyltransferase [Myxococcaceae bacterium]